MRAPAAADALLFDFGGVLVGIDFDRVLRRWAGHARAPFERVKARFSHGPAYQAHERGEMDAREYYRALREELALDLTDEQLEDGWQQVFVAPIDPTLELLRHLEGRVPMHLMSNTNLAHYHVWSRRYARELAPLGRWFISHEMGMRKPEPEAFLQVARELRIAPGRILFFDDTEPNVEGARAVGLQAVCVRSPEDVRRALAPWLGPRLSRTRGP